MRAEPNLRIEQYRRVHPLLGGSPAGANYGFFVVDYFDEQLRIISSGTGDEWEHVSVSCPGSLPGWNAMNHVKDLFWDDEETVIQFHPKKSAYVNYHPHTLHLWKLAKHDAKLPPRELIA